MHLKLSQVNEPETNSILYKLLELQKNVINNLNVLSLNSQTINAEEKLALNLKKYNLNLLYKNISNKLLTLGYIYSPLDQQLIPTETLSPQLFQNYTLLEKAYILNNFINSGLFPDNNGTPISIQDSPQVFEEAIKQSDYAEILDLINNSNNSLSSPSPFINNFNNNKLPNPLTGELIDISKLTPQLKYNLLLLNRDHMRAMALNKADVTSNLDSGDIGDSGTLRRIPYGWKPLAELAVERDILLNPNNYLTFTDEELNNLKTDETPNGVPRVLNKDLLITDMANLGVLSNNTLGVQYLDNKGNPILGPITDYIFSNDYNRYNYSNIKNEKVSKDILDHLRVLNTILRDPSPNGTPELYRGRDALIREHLLSQFPERTFTSKDNSIYRVGLLEFADRLRNANKQTPNNIVEDFLNEYSEETGKDYLSLLNNEGARVLLNNESLKDRFIREYQQKAQLEIGNLNTLISNFEKQHANTPGFNPEDKSPIGWGDKLWGRKGVSQSDAQMYALANLTGFDPGSLSLNVGYDARMQVYKDLFKKYTANYYNKDYQEILNKIGKLNSELLINLQNVLNSPLASNEELAHILALLDARQNAANTLFGDKTTELAQYVNKESNLAAENAINLYMNYDYQHGNKPIDFSKPILDQLVPSKLNAIDPLRRGHLSDISPLEALSIAPITGNENHNLKLLLVGTGKILDPVIGYVPNKIIDSIKGYTSPENPTLLEYLSHLLTYDTFKNLGINAFLPSEVLKTVAHINPLVHTSEGLGTIIGANSYADTNPGSAGASLDADILNNPAHLLEDIYNKGKYGTSAPRTSGGVLTALGLLDTLLLGKGGSISKAMLKELPVTLRLAVRLGTQLLPGLKSFLSQFGNNAMDSVLGETVFRPATSAIRAGRDSWQTNAEKSTIERLIRSIANSRVAPIKDFAGLLKTDLSGNILDKTFTIMNPALAYNPYFNNKTLISQGLPRMFASGTDIVGKSLTNQNGGVQPTGVNLDNNL